MHRDADGDDGEFGAASAGEPTVTFAVERSAN
jgi:hypothetical protein